MIMRPYQQVPIQESGEPLVPIPLEGLARVLPHPYIVLGAPYGNRSPFYVRQGVLMRLLEAQDRLQVQYPGWHIQIFDAYRPVAVQQFMVDYTFASLCIQQGLDREELTSEQAAAIWQQVYQFWAPPSPDRATPPPHSTGAAVDITLVDGSGQPVNMGSPIDEPTPRSYPDHFAASTDPIEQQYQCDRNLLKHVMTGSGFCQHPNEWWHFSWGDQFWAWQTTQATGSPISACYGRVD